VPEFKPFTLDMKDDEKNNTCQTLFQR
jgi:hypothetical protein